MAILTILWHHATQSFFATQAAYLSSTSPSLFGSFGVDVFFGLSGLLITTLLLKQWGETGALNLKAFYVRRAFRILPVYLLYLCVIGVLGFLQGPRELGSCLLFFRNYLANGWLWPHTQHLWSLSVEEHFYLIWPGLLALCGVKWGRHVAAYFAIALGFWRLVEPQMNLHLFPDVIPHFRSDLRMDALLWGAVVAFTLHHTKAREQLRRQLQFWPWLGMVALALASIVYYSSLSSIFLAVMIPMVLAGTLLHPQWRVSRLLDSKPVAWVGRISYSLYIWQPLFLVAGWEHSTHAWTQWPWNLAVTLAVACASYYLVEIPLLRVGGRLASRSTVPVAGEVDAGTGSELAYSGKPSA